MGQGPVDLDSPFDIEPSLPSGCYARPASPLQRFAEEVLAVTDSAVVAVVELVADEGRTAVVGHAPRPDGAEEALLSLWLQVGETEALRPVPPRLRRLFPADTALVMPILTPSGVAGAIAVSPPTKSRRVLRQLESLALDYAVRAEERVREDGTVTHPAPDLALIA